MDTRVAVISIIIENKTSAEKVNQLLHDYQQYILGRMGLPYREKNIGIICVALDAPQTFTAALTGKIGNLNGVTVKTAYSNVISPCQH